MANAFFKGEGKPEHELAFRNPAVLFENLGASEFAQLPRETQQKVRLAAQEALGILQRRYGASLAERMSERGDDYGNEVAAPIGALQRMVNADEAPKEAQRYIAVACNDLGEAFATAMQVGEERGWHEATDPSRLDYYAGNAAAGSRFVH